jgi:Fe2+ or Zn2+ uptake regulation protein
MEDRELLLKAIDNYDAYSIPQRETLKALLKLSSDGIVIIKPAQLSSLTNLSRTLIYYNLKVFEKEGLIKKLDRVNRLYRFKIEEDKLKHFIEVYNRLSDYKNS